MTYVHGWPVKTYKKIYCHLEFNRKSVKEKENNNNILIAFIMYTHIFLFSFLFTSYTSGGTK